MDVQGVGLGSRPRGQVGTRKGAPRRGSAGLGASTRLPGAVVLQSFLATDPHFSGNYRFSRL